jgi:hypothetical protein
MNSVTALMTSHNTEGPASRELRLLREEVESLRLQALKGGGTSDVDEAALRMQLEESERLLRKMNLSWEERMVQTRTELERVAAAAQEKAAAAELESERLLQQLSFRKHEGRKTLTLMAASFRAKEDAMKAEAARERARCSVFSTKSYTRGVPLSHAFAPLEASKRVTNGIHLRCSLRLPVDTVHYVETPKAKLEKQIRSLMGKSKIRPGIPTAGSKSMNEASAAIAKLEKRMKNTRNKLEDGGGTGGEVFASLKRSPPPSPSRPNNRSASPPNKKILPQPTVLTPGGDPLMITAVSRLDEAINDFHLASLKSPMQGNNVGNVGGGPRTLNFSRLQGDVDTQHSGESAYKRQVQAVPSVADVYTFVTGGVVGVGPTGKGVTVAPLVVTNSTSPTTFQLHGARS